MASSQQGGFPVLPAGAGCSVSLKTLPRHRQLMICRSAKCFQALPERGCPLPGLHPPPCIVLWSQTLLCVRNENKMTMGVEKQPFYTPEMRGRRGSWGEIHLPPCELLLGKSGSAARKDGKAAAPRSWGRWREPEHPKAQPPPSIPCERRGPRSRARPTRAASGAAAARLLPSALPSKLGLLLRSGSAAEPSGLRVTHTATEQHTQTRRAHTGHACALSGSD